MKFKRQQTVTTDYSRIQMVNRRLISPLLFIFAQGHSTSIGGYGL